MRYRILKPIASTIDPRTVSFRNEDEFQALFEQTDIIPESSEEWAARRVRQQYPNAIALPFPVSIGSGKRFLMGMIDDAEARKVVNPDRPIPFVMFVQASADSEVERKRMQRGELPFREEVWRLRPVCPDIYETHAVEIRGSGLVAPSFSDARVGYQSGRLTIFANVFGTDVSIAFDDVNLRLSSHGK